MSMGLILKVIFLAGAIGGLVNAIITDNGFFCPRVEQVKNIRVVRPGFIGNVFIGAVAAIVSWGLYSPFAQVNLLERHELSLTPSTIAAAMLIGVAGAKWLTSEVDKGLLKVAASEAAKSKPCAQTAQEILGASPAQVLNITRNLDPS
ncbi:hypothetical protein [Leptolyngbya sp. FACHB-711]|uniref:hypothetical protein n=1 Tax=Leptolyngbya sp. FACHB-711 TaxID=2692813 RepID=UPI001684DCAD|nr:hypothetical protein [Leptolyngbya sp. FACHB-711]MBD2028137.1 hypothetical protein [Leptolyngbya sp. FACHB-711]